MDQYPKKNEEKDYLIKKTNMKNKTMIEVTLPDDKEQLEKAKDILKKVSDTYKIYLDMAKGEMEKKYGKKHKFKNEEERQAILLSLLDIPLYKRKAMVYLADTVLGVVADMSTSRFEIRDQLEEDYKMKYLKSPELGKTLFFEHYDKIHQPYDKIKNRCFDLLSKFDPEATIVDTI
jgi:hypothetical protein